MSITVGAKGWHIEKGVPIAIILAMAGQLTVVSWILSKYDSQIKDDSNRITATEQAATASAGVLRTVSEKIIRIETKLDFLVDRGTQQTPIRK